MIAGVSASIPAETVSVKAVYPNHRKRDSKSEKRLIMKTPLSGGKTDSGGSPGVRLAERQAAEGRSVGSGPGSRPP